MSNVLSALKGSVTAAAYAAAWWLVCRVPESWGRWASSRRETSPGGGRGSGSRCWRRT